MRLAETVLHVLGRSLGIVVHSMVIVGKELRIALLSLTVSRNGVPATVVDDSMLELGVELKGCR